MSSRRYWNYLRIKEETVSVFNENVDRNNPEMWKNFVPHEQFCRLVEEVRKNLAKEKGHRGGLWLWGAYGTGKTYGVLTLKHLLEEEQEEVEEYFEKWERVARSELRGHIGYLRNQRKVRVVYRSPAPRATEGGLLFGMVSALKEAADKAGVETPPYSGFETVRDVIADMKEERFREVIKRYAPGLGALSIDEALERIKVRDAQVVAGIAEALESARRAPAPTVEEFKDWLPKYAEVMPYPVLLLWDEFTDFLLNPSANIALFQEVVQTLSQFNVFLVICTHRHPETFEHAMGADTFKKLMDRFEVVTFRLKHSLVFDLMCQPFAPVDRKVWDEVQNDLYEKTGEVINTLVSEAGPESQISVQALRRLLPLHPTTAMLLAHLSQEFSSAQRTLFSFLTRTQEKGDGPFIQFLKNNEIGAFVTPDALFDYFAEEMSEHEEMFRDALGWFKQNEKNLEGAEKAVLKTALLLIILQHKSGIVQDLPVKKLRAAFRESLELCFAGTDVRVNACLDYLFGKQVLTEDPVSGNINFPWAEVSDKQLKELEKELKDWEKFMDKDLLQKYVEMKLPSTVYAAHFRCEACHSKRLMQGVFKPRHLMPWEIGVCLCLAPRREQENFLKKISSYFGERWVVLVPEWHLDEKMLGDWARAKAWAEIVRGSRGSDAAEVHEKNAEKIRTAALSQMDGAYVTVVMEDKTQRVLMADIEQLLFEVFRKRYRHNPQLDTSIGAKSGIWKFTSGPAATIEAALGKKRPKGALKPLIRVIDKADSLPVGWLREMERQLAEQIEQRVKKTGGELPLSELLAVVRGCPFGLYPCDGSAYIITTLLKKLLKGYFLTDGDRYLEPEMVLKEALLDTFSGKGRWRVAQDTPLYREFRKALNTAFGLGLDVMPPRKALERLRIWVTQQELPLWSLKYSLSGEPAEICDALSRLIAGDRSQEQIDHFLDEHLSSFASCAGEIADKIKANGLEEGFREFISHSGLTDDVLVRWKLTPRSVADDLRRRLEGDLFFWNENSAKHAARELAQKLHLLASLQSISGIKCDEVTEPENFVRHIISKRRVPLWMFEDVADARQKEAIAILRRIRDGVEGAQGYRSAAEGLESHAQTLREILKNPKRTLAAFIKKTFREELSETDLEDLMDNVSLAETTRDEAVEHIRKWLDAREIVKMRRRWQQTLKEVLGTETIRDWLRKNELPSWLVYESMSANHQHLFRLSLSAGQQDKEALTLLLDKGKGMLEELREMKMKSALSHFLEKQNRPTGEKSLDRFIKRLRKRLPVAPDSWTRQQVLEEWDKWVDEIVTKRQEEVISKIDKMEAEKMRDVLIHLATKERREIRLAVLRAIVGEVLAE